MAPEIMINPAIELSMMIIATFQRGKMYLMVALAPKPFIALLLTTVNRMFFEAWRINDI